MKKVFYLIGLFCVVLFNMKVAYANDIKSITMDIYIDSEGDAHVTESWYASLTYGNEGYKTYYNLGDSTIEDFKVSMNGENFTTISSWDTEASFADKSYKAGINYISNGLELCFGISKYGTNTYVMEYTITNFVSTISDADMVYWTLINPNLSDSPEYVYVKIHSDFAYEDTLDAWGYGYDGYAYLTDGYIELISDDGLDSDEFLTILIKFPKGTFNTDSVLDENFEYYYNLAEGKTSESDDADDDYYFYPSGYTTSTSGNDIRSILMDIYVDSEGDAHVTETWYASLTTGTEGYKPYYNLGNSTIEDFKVSLNGEYFTTISYWNTEASFTSKSYKAGINYISDGLELCFGISSYGLNKYVMEYTITNFVSTTNDADMVYWQLVPYELSDSPEYVYIKIYSDFAYEDTLDVWGYGYEGYAYVYDGYIELISEGSLDSDEYMVVLVKYPKGTFNTTSVLDEDFDYYLEMAEDGATSYSDDSNLLETILETIINASLTFTFYVLFYGISFSPIIIGILLSLKKRRSKKEKYGTKKLKFGKGEKNVKGASYFRDIPCNKDVFKAYWVACQYNLVANNTDFLGAILLKWLKDGNIQNILHEKTNTRSLQLALADNLNELEQELYSMVLAASKDGILDNNEFKNYCTKNYDKILKWFDKVMDYATLEFVKEGLITEKKGMFGKEYIISSSMKEYGLQMAGLKNFLKDFSNIKERESIEVKLWEYYLIYAQIFGIAGEVAEEFKKLYPNVITEDYYNDIVFVYNISFQGANAAFVEQTRVIEEARERARSYSGGGGGSSSSGGGGGSFGGGGGGGGFR